MKKRDRSRHHRATEGRKGKLAFLFHADHDHSQGVSHLSESVKRLKKDLREFVSFYYVAPVDQSVDLSATGITPVNTGGRLLPDIREDYDYLVVMDAGNMVRNLNFNEFFHHDLDYPDRDAWAWLYYQNQLPGPSGCLVIGRNVAEYLSGLTSTSKTFQREDILWHLRRMNLRSQYIHTEIDQPYGEPPLEKHLFRSPQPLLSRWYRWNFTTALQEYRSSSRPAFMKESSLLRPLFLLAALLTLVILPVISYHAGISGDEDKHWMQAGKVYDYFASGGQDTAALNDPKYLLNYYGQSFDLFTYGFIKAFNIQKIYETRHVLNGMTGALTIISAALLSRLLFGNAAGLLTIFLLFFSPRFLGHAMNNPMDIPFALGYIFTLLQIVRFLRRLPEFSPKIAILITLGIAYTISIRIGGLILIPYLFMFAALYVIFTRWPWKFMSGRYLLFLRKGMIYLIIVSIAGYFISLLPWPYALQSPLKNPVKSLDAMSNLSVALKVMFEGKFIWSNSLPWYYLPKYILLTVPLVVLVFFTIPLFGFHRYRKQVHPFWIFALYFATIFPVFYIIYKSSNVYGGWRHLLFVYPAMVTLAAGGIIWLRNVFPGKILQTAFVVLIIVSMAGPVFHIARNYPLQYIYYNQLAGGVDKAYKKYETDYYLESLKPGTEWIKKNILPGRKKKTIIISNAPGATMRYYFRKYADTVSLPYTRYYDRGTYNWDYAVFFMNYIDPWQIRHGLWPPRNTVHEVTVDGVPVCAIVKRENRDDYYGIARLQDGIKARNTAQILGAVEQIEKAIAYDPHNEIAYLTAAQGYIVTTNYDRARQLLQKLLTFYPDYDKALNMMGYSYLSEGSLTSNPVLTDRAIAVFNKVLVVNPNNAQANNNLGLAYMLKGDNNRAIKFFQEAIRLNPRIRDAYYSIATILEQKGDFEKAAQIRKYAASI